MNNFKSNEVNDTLQKKKCLSRLEPGIFAWHLNINPLSLLSSQPKHRKTTLSATVNHLQKWPIVLFAYGRWYPASSMRGQTLTPLMITQMRHSTIQTLKLSCLIILDGPRQVQQRRRTIFSLTIISLLRTSFTRMLLWKHEHFSRSWWIGYFLCVCNLILL